MNCEQARDLAALAASGDVTTEERSALAAHNAGCGECRAEADAYAELCGQLAAMRGESAPEYVYAAVRTRVVAQIGERRRPHWVAAWSTLAAVVACSVVTIVALRDRAPIVTQPPGKYAVPATVAALSTEAPAIVAPSLRHRVRERVVRAAVQEASDPLVVQMFTDDPDVVIYWIADARGKRSERESIQ